MKVVLSLATGAACFLATALPSAAVVAYGIPAGTAGTQNFGGQLGMDFDVVAPQGISVTSLGAFDSNSDGINGNIEVGIFDRNTQTLVGSSITITGMEGTAIGGSRFVTLASPITLSAGFQGTIVARGYNANENNGNVGTGSTVGTVDDGGGALQFVGTSRFGNDNAMVFPGSPDGGPVNRYHAGSFEYTPIPEPSSVALLLGAIGFFGLRRRR